jgi:hypothetical protein
MAGAGAAASLALTLLRSKRKDFLHCYPKMNESLI